MITDRFGKEWIYFDGGLGTMLQERGLQGGEYPETWNLTHPEELIAIHKAYLEAGCHVINANTFGANGLKFDNVEEIITAGIQLAKEAKKQAGRMDAYVALDIGPTGKLLEPMGDLPFEKAVSYFAQMVKAGVKAGADLILIETMSDTYEAKAAVLAAKENSSLPVIVTMIFDENQRLLTGGSVESAVAMLEGLRVDALGINCGLGPKQMLPVVKRIREVSSLPIIVNPNAGLPVQVNGKTVYDLKADDFAQAMVKMAQIGVQGLGGCCGTTPEYIQKMIEAIKDIPCKPNTMKEQTWVTSYASAVQIGKKAVVIGERINPTGKKRFQQALRNKEFDYILSQALEQEEAGAQILDVNVGLPDIDEADMMKETVVRLQNVCALPLQIDTGNLEALENALRLYNGKPMVNSVNGKLDSMESVFPLIQKYGAVVVGLCLDESGIPSTSKERLAIAQKIVKKAQEYGIQKKDIVIDGLAMTISSQSDGALVTLDTLQKVKEELNVSTILGVSNISFGLPQREIINSYFLSMALQSGLSCAMINPNNEMMKKAFDASMALMNQDAQCMHYISSYSKQVEEKKSENPEISLSFAIQKGIQDRVKEITTSLLETKEPLGIIDEELIPALDLVGKGFEQGTVFLPQLLMSAEAAKASFEVLKEKMEQNQSLSKGKIILATVQGDIHDIGKNIVKVLLENYGYEVLDLGKDVAPEVIVKTAISEEVKLVGLSALMTTTVKSMEKTIELLHKEKPDTFVVVGGAVLNQEYADQIHADHYAKDAMATVRYAEQILNQ
ncbi:homocysteine S-methyltransferase family protein [Faecalicoccus pleomorphus]|uniref:homocysteine S-methyltransferase family protein n=1 Tax=Faecalicoccus pleomorphus TaxID=1323 RepID=UPI0025A32C9A|nr:homocysteine S-methyltransferase family protein [Faecalicoccus pleomorphus]MDM8293084.1 homocysteine S-methyltransferase family protein [Faecalicoccus pleomorphus]